MRTHIIAVVVLASTGCSPDVVNDTYFCGPELACPPEQACDEVSLVCTVPARAQAFECGPDLVEDAGNDTLETAVELDAPVCDQLLLNEHRCLNDSKVDHYRVAITEECIGGSSVAVGIRFPFAFVPLSAELIDEAGQVVASAEDCLETEPSEGLNRRCLEAPVAANSSYVVRVSMDDVDDCDGGCRHSWYQISTYVKSR